MKMKFFGSSNINLGLRNPSKRSKRELISSNSKMSKKKKEAVKQVQIKKVTAVQQVKQEKEVAQTQREEFKKEIDIKNNEKIWKIALHEKKLENSKLYNKIKVHNEARKVYECKLKVEETRADDINKKMKDLEKLENHLLEKLRATHNSHLNAYAEMQKVYDSRPQTRHMSPISGASTTTSTSPFRKKH
jgi:hypothetical protein